MSEATEISSDEAILRATSSGMLPQATVLVQIRQMKALDRIAEGLEKLCAQLDNFAPTPPVLMAGRDNPYDGFSGGRAGGSVQVGPTVITEGTYEDVVAKLREATQEIAYDDHGPTIPIGPATDVEDAGTPRARRRRSHGEGGG